jgi:hypothetical protein
VGHPKIRDLPLLLEVPGSGEGPRAVDVKKAQKVVLAGIKLYAAPSKTASASTSAAAKKTTKK